jgi:hypothetical protein
MYNDLLTVDANVFKTSSVWLTGCQDLESLGSQLRLFAVLIIILNQY